MPVAEVEEVVKSAKEAIEEHCMPVAECVGDALHSAGRHIKTAWNDLQDSAVELGEDTRHAIRRHPVTSVFIVGGAGLVAGAVLGWIARRSKR